MSKELKTTENRTKLKIREVREYRKKLLHEQKNICPLCSTEIFPGEDTLDHNHETGHVRKVLHRSCNQVEGRILSWIRRSRASKGEELKFLKNLVRYWSTECIQTPIHPNHKTDTDRKVSALRKRLKRAKRRSTKQRLEKEIKDML